MYTLLKYIIVFGLGTFLILKGADAFTVWADNTRSLYQLDVNETN